jgi:hypothetical protein
LYQHADAHMHGLAPPPARLQSEFDKTREGRLAKNAGRRSQVDGCEAGLLSRCGPRPRGPALGGVCTRPGKPVA